MKAIGNSTCVLMKSCPRCTDRSVMSSRCHSLLSEAGLFGKVIADAYPALLQRDWLQMGKQNCLADTPEASEDEVLSDHVLPQELPELFLLIRSAGEVGRIVPGARPERVSEEVWLHFNGLQCPCVNLRPIVNLRKGIDILKLAGMRVSCAIPENASLPPLMARCCRAAGVTAPGSGGRPRPG